MTDIVERLRAGLPMHKRVLDASLIREAADEIERLRVEGKRLHGLIGLLYEYKAMVAIGSAEAIGEAEARLAAKERSDD